MMQKVILPAVALAFTLGQASAADAATHRRHVRAHHHQGVAHRYRNDDTLAGYRYRNDDTLAGYYEHRLDAVRFGSQCWWYIYDQQHGGRRLQRRGLGA